MLSRNLRNPPTSTRWRPPGLADRRVPSIRRLTAACRSVPRRRRRWQASRASWARVGRRDRKQQVSCGLRDAAPATRAGLPGALSTAPGVGHSVRIAGMVRTAFRNNAKYVGIFRDCLTRSGKKQSVSLPLAADGHLVPQPSRTGSTRLSNHGSGSPLHAELRHSPEERSLDQPLLGRRMVRQIEGATFLCPRNSPLTIHPGWTFVPNTVSTVCPG